MEGTTRSLRILWILIALSFVHAGDRQIRALPFPDSSTVGILAAIATPIEVPDREVFFSYNFEANYNSHAVSDLIDLGALQKYGIEGRSGSGAQVTNDTSIETGTTTTTTIRPAPKRGLASFLSRKIVYDFLENKMKAFGLNGKECLMKTICQVADIALGRNNGVLGDLVHVIFTPSTSKDKVAAHYNRAEHTGSSGLGCGQYNDRCPRSIIDFISIDHVD